MTEHFETKAYGATVAQSHLPKPGGDKFSLGAGGRGQTGSISIVNNGAAVAYTRANDDDDSDDDSSSESPTTPRTLRGGVRATPKSPRSPEMARTVQDNTSTWAAKIQQSPHKQALAVVGATLKRLTASSPTSIAHELDLPMLRQCYAAKLRELDQSEERLVNDNSSSLTAVGSPKMPEAEPRRVAENPMAGPVTPGPEATGTEQQQGADGAWRLFSTSTPRAVGGAQVDGAAAVERGEDAVVAWARQYLAKLASTPSYMALKAEALALFDQAQWAAHKEQITELLKAEDAAGATKPQGADLPLQVLI